MRGGRCGHHTQAHWQRLSCCLLLREDPGALVHPATAQAHVHAHLPHVHGGVARSCWERTRTRHLLLTGPRPALGPGCGSRHSSRPSATQLCGPTQPRCPQQAGSGPSGHPGTRQPTLPSVGQKPGSSNSHFLRWFHATSSWAEAQPLPQVKAQRQRAPGPGTWAGRGGAAAADGKGGQDSLRWAGDCSPLPLCHFH